MIEEKWWESSGQSLLPNDQISRWISLTHSSYDWMHHFTARHKIVLINVFESCTFEIGIIIEVAVDWLNPLTSIALSFSKDSFGISQWKRNIWMETTSREFEAQLWHSVCSVQNTLPNVKPLVSVLWKTCWTKMIRQANRDQPGMGIQTQLEKGGAIDA